MKTVGIICEYNPIHLGHVGHIKKTRKIVGEDSAIICVMSGNYVQRGDFAVFSKHVRAAAAVRSGADLVVELPTPYVLLSAEGFARAGVYILDNMGVCEYISFGSESGDLEKLKSAAELVASHEAEEEIKKWLGEGLSYAAALQKAADKAAEGEFSDIFRSPNNVLGIEYLKAINYYNSKLKPLTMTRTGGDHDSDEGYSASRLRKILMNGETPWDLMPEAAAKIYEKEILEGRGPVFMKDYEAPMLSRLRMIEDYSQIPNNSEGIDKRFLKYAMSEPTIEEILAKIKTKRYPMSRIRRMLMCACLGIKAEDSALPPSYIKLLAMNEVGAKLLKSAKENSKLPIITKPAEGKKLFGRAKNLFKTEVSATDFYSLALSSEKERRGGKEWVTSPVVIDLG